MSFLIAPTEHELLKRGVGTCSSVPEKYGSDVWWPHATLGSVGVQRKTITDLLASLNDSRVARELGMMKRLGVGIWMIEGEPKWTSEGTLIQSRRPITKQQWRGVTLSLQSQGYWVVSTSDLTDSIECLSQLKRHLEKQTHSMATRPKAGGSWGKATNREWGVHTLQSWDGIGQTTAEAIYDQYGLPLMWTVTEKELLKVKGVGKERARRMIESLSPEKN